MKKTVGILVTIISSCALGAIAQEQPRVLTLNSPIERELAAGQKHGYSLNLKPNQIARVVVEQRGVDLVVAVISPGGKKLFEVDSPTGTQGNETATIFASEAGEYRVELRPLDQKVAPGKYQIRLDKYLIESEYQAERLAALGRVWGR